MVWLYRCYSSCEYWQQNETQKTLNLRAACTVLEWPQNGAGTGGNGYRFCSQWRSRGFVGLGKMKTDGGWTPGREKSCSNGRTALAQEEVGMKQPRNNSDWKAKKPSKRWAAFLQLREWDNLIVDPHDGRLPVTCMSWGTRARMHLSCGTGHGPCKMESWSRTLGEQEAGKQRCGRIILFSSLAEAAMPV